MVLLNKPWGVLSQFSEESGHRSLAEFGLPAGIYAAGRLDRDSEGLLVLTNHGPLQARISHPRMKWPKEYLAQVEGLPGLGSLEQLRQGVRLKDGLTAPARADVIADPGLWRREPPIRERQNVPTSWLRLEIREGKNRQVRRMTAHVGLPTLRLVRTRVGPLTLAGLELGQWRELTAAEVAELQRWRPGPFRSR